MGVVVFVGVCSDLLFFFFFLFLLVIWKSLFGLPKVSVWKPLVFILVIVDYLLHVHTFEDVEHMFLVSVFATI